MYRILLAVVLLTTWVDAKEGQNFPPGYEPTTNSPKEIGLEESRISADAGDAAAQARLAKSYQTGREKDDAEAIRWYRKAAEQDSAEAELALGNIYAKGKGVARDLTEAARWYRLAAEQGNIQAQEALGELCKKGEGVQRDVVEAYMWFALATKADQILGGDITIVHMTRDRIIAQRMTDEQLAEGKRRVAAFSPRRPAPTGAKPAEAIAR